MPAKLYVGIKAVILKDNKMLLLRREDGTEGPFWDLPGGRLQPNETITQALIRELQEELPSFQNPQIGELLWVYKRTKPLSDGAELLLIYYHLKGNLGEIVLSSEHSRSVWVGEADFASLDAPYNPGFPNLLSKALESL